MNASFIAEATRHKGAAYPPYATALGFIWCDDSADPVWIYKMLALGTDPSIAANWIELYRVNKNVGGLNPPAGGVFRKNAIINGNFDFWQRGTLLAAAASSRYLADKWFTNGIGSTVAPSQQAFALGQTAVPDEPAYFHRTAVVSSAGAANCAYHSQRIEGVRTFAGQQVVLSFWMKADAAKNIAVEFIQSFGTGGAPSADVTAIGVTTCALTTTMAKVTVTATLPSINGKTLGSNGNDYLEIRWWYDAGTSFNGRTNNLGQRNGTYDIAKVQLEQNCVATVFEYRPRAAELLLCQRYAVYFGPISTQFAACYGDNSTVIQAPALPFPVPMRAAPTLTVIAGAGAKACTFGGSTVGTVSGIGSQNTKETFSLILNGSGFSTAAFLYFGANAFLFDGDF